MTSSLGKLRNHLETSHSDYNVYEILPFWQGVTISPDRATFKHMNFSRQYFTPRSLCHIWLYRLGTAQGGDTSHIGYHRFGAYQFSQFSSVAQSCMTLRPHEPQHTRPPCPSPTPRVHPNPCPLSRWCHPTISSSIIPFSSWLESFPASESFPKSHLFTSGGQSTGASASTSVLPVNTQDWSPLGWTGWISLQSKALSRVFSNTTVQKHQFFITQLSL